MKGPDDFLWVLDVNRAPHLITVGTFQMVATGRIPVSALPDSVLRKVVLEWLISMGVKS